MEDGSCARWENTDPTVTIRRSGVGVTVLLRSAFFGTFQYHAGRDKSHRQNPSWKVKLENPYAKSHQHSHHDYRTHS